MLNHIFVFCGLLLTVNKCRNIESVNDLSHPTFSESDTIYHGIFMPWDGIWEGSFEIYKDPNGQQTSDHTDLTMADTIRVRNYQLTNTVGVRQKYESVTPYYQLVEITDTYVNAHDTVKATAKGVNKVQDGQIWCIVDKPDDLVIHLGRQVSPGTLVWSRNEQGPLRKEYFLESIVGNTYFILGYGYYGEDDPNLSPRTWFVARYRHISDYFK
ncbi:MAG: hypothetical protein IPL46_32585 [Saprospiraceae bacterium]|nr:hypothetical protein [Saprospiraceae bacterium]